MKEFKIVDESLNKKYKNITKPEIPRSDNISK